MTINVTNIIRDHPQITDSAIVAARQVVEAIQQNQFPITISLQGVRGVPSSFFNALLFEIHQAAGLKHFQNNQIRFEFDAPSQEAIFNRSFKAFSESIASQAS